MTIEIDTAVHASTSVADFADVVVEEITVDAQEFGAPRAVGGADVGWGEQKSDALRQARNDAVLTASTDSVRAYLKQIGKIALLRAEQEVELAKRIEAGLFAAERLSEAARSNEHLSASLLRDLHCLVRDGERAKTHLLEANLRLVVSIAKRYTGRGMPFLDPKIISNAC